MKKIKKLAYLLMVTVTVFAGLGFISTHAGFGNNCLHANGVVTHGVFLYTTTVRVATFCDGILYYCTEVRNIENIEEEK